MLKMLVCCVMVSVITACSWNREVSDLRQSGVVLYPIAKTGDALDVFGKGIKKLATPFDGRPERINSPLLSEQKTEIEKYAVSYDGTWSVESVVGLGAGSWQFQEPIKSLLLRAEAMAGASFDWYLNPNLPDGGMAFPGGVIVINPILFSRYSEAAAIFMMEHEIGHHMNNHTTPAGLVQGMNQPWHSRDRESTADYFAATTMMNSGYPPQLILYGAIQLFGNSPGDATHYPGTVRIAQIRSTLGV